jgi:glutamate/tyrosine decarboxylase-like PLP-dependent enzyme
VHAFFDAPLPREATPLEQVYRDWQEQVRPYPMGNIHPRFWAWFMGAGNFTGALADFLAAVDGSNLGGGHTAPALVDRQVVRWLREMVGFPEGASGTLTNGGSAANLVALTVARNVKAAEAGVDVRAAGVTALTRPLRFYASEQVHSCHQKALEVLGLGRAALHLVATDAGHRIDLAALKDLDIRGDLRIGRLRLGRVTAANITLAFDAAAGVLELTPRAMSGDTARRDGGKRPGRPAGH